MRRAAVSVAAAIVLALAAGASTAGVGPVTGSADADERAERTSLPESPRRPQVYLAYTGTQALAGANDAQWSFVRANLDGWWGNVVGMSLDQVVAVTRKVATRDLVVENDIAPGGACSPFVGGTVTFFDRVESVAPDLEFERLAGALYAGSNPNCWGASGGITTAQQQYAAQGYPAVWSLYQPQNLSSTVNAGAFPTIAAGSSGDVALRNSDAVVLECPVDACTDPTFGAPFWNALLEAHARDVPFVWYTANSRLYGINSGWLGRIQRTYNAAAAFGLWRPEDVIVIVHNTAAGSYPMLPETNADGTSADTTTGILHWLLTQTPITTLCTDSVAC